jgi:hypothetical protein
VDAVVRFVLIFTIVASIAAGVHSLDVVAQLKRRSELWLETRRSSWRWRGGSSSNRWGLRGRIAMRCAALCSAGAATCRNACRGGNEDDSLFVPKVPILHCFVVILQILVVFFGLAATASDRLLHTNASI